MRFAELSRKSYFRLFLVYGVFLVLMLLLILPLIGQVTRTLEERSIGSYTDELNRNIGRLDGQIDSFAAIVRHIAAERRYARTLHASGNEDHERLLMLRNFQQELYDAASGFDGIRDFAVLTANGAVICRTRIYPVHAGMNTRCYRSKIGRLPFAIRNELNERIRDGAQGAELLDWLNGLKETKRILREMGGPRSGAASTSGRAASAAAINAQNLTDWRSSGYKDWLDDQKDADRIRRLAEVSQTIATAAGGNAAGVACNIATAKIMDAL